MNVSFFQKLFINTLLLLNIIVKELRPILKLIGHFHIYTNSFKKRLYIDEIKNDF